MIKSISFLSKVPEESQKRHLTAEEVYKNLTDEGLEIGLATIYRVLTQFEQAGILIRHQFESGKGTFELKIEDHDHLVCTKCGVVEEFFDEQIESRQKKIAEDNGFVIEDHTQILYGKCARCQD